MSNIKISQPVTKDHIRDIIARRCPDLELGTLGPMISAAASSSGGALINVNKKVVTVSLGPRSGGMLALSMLIALTGIGLVICAVTVLPKWKSAATRVKAILVEELPTR